MGREERTDNGEPMAGRRRTDHGGAGRDRAACWPSSVHADQYVLRTALTRRRCVAARE